MHRQVTTEERQLAVRHRDWAVEAIGGSLYMYTLWILKWKGNDSMGSKIDRKSQVEAELEITLGETGWDCQTVSVAQWWVVIKEKFVTHVMVGPFAMWEIWMAWNMDIMSPGQKLRIGPTGTSGGWASAINHSTETIEAIIVGGYIVDLQNELGKRGVSSEVQMPKYGYIGEDAFYQSTKDENMIDDWAIVALGGLVYTDRKGRDAGKDSPICHYLGGYRTSMCV